MPKPKVMGPGLAVVRSLPKIYLTVRQVAALFQVSTATIYRLVTEGALPHVRVSNAIRFEPEEIERFAEARSLEARHMSAHDEQARN